MGAFLIYMLKSAVCLLLFYVFFKAFLSRDTFFRFNRFVLLGGMLVCLLLPSVHLEIPGKAMVICGRMGGFEKRWQDIYAWEEITGDEERENLVLEVAGTEAVGGPVGEWTDKEAASVTWGKLLTVVYLWGALGVCIWLCAAFTKICKLVRHSRKRNWGKYTLALTAADVCPFSWGKYIVLSEEDYRVSPQEILAHEKVHADKGHTLDLCFTELILVIQWFNPAVWLLKKELQEIHEYEADNGVIDQGIDATKYQLLLVKKAVGARLYSIANSFNHSKLKNRITMMLKEKSNRWARLKVLLLIPPAALLMLAFARPGETDSTIRKDDKVTQIPEISGTDSLKMQYITASPELVLMLTVKAKVADKPDTLHLKLGMGEEDVEGTVDNILKGNGYFNEIIRAVVGTDAACPEIQKYAEKIDKALKARGVKDIKYQSYISKTKGQSAMASCWTEQFFREELKKNGGDRYNPVFKDLQEHFGDRWCQILLNRAGQVSVNHQLVAAGKLKDYLLEILAGHLTGSPVFMTLQKDVRTSGEDYQQTLDAIGEAYQEARRMAQQQGISPEDINRVCPVWLAFMEDKDSCDIRK